MTLKIESVISGSPVKSWLSCPNYFQDIAKSKVFGKKDISFITGKLADAIHNKKAVHIRNWLTLGLILNSDLFVENIKKNGTLRPSKYDFDVILVLKGINKIESKLPLSQNVKSYFSSLKNLYVSAIEIRVIRRNLVKHLKQGKYKLLREVLILVDAVFMLQATRGHSSKVEGVIEDLSFFSPETLAESVGYILYLYTSNVGSFEPLDITHNISEIKVKTLIVTSAKIRAFCEFEVMIDYYGYTLLPSQENEKELNLSPPSENFEKAYRLGYIQTEFQVAISLYETETNSMLRLEEYGRNFYKEFGSKLITLKTDPISRYTLAFPWVEPVIETISTSSFFAEEVLALEYFSKEWGVQHEDLLKFEVSEGLTLWDIFKTHRTINLFRWIMVAHLEPLFDKEHQIVMQSLVPFFTTENLKIMLGEVLGEKSEKVIEFMSYTFGASGVFDLQYQPIVQMYGGYSIPYNILANSNILRNSLQLSRKRFFDDGQNDPLTRLMYEVFAKKNFQVEENVKYKWKQQDGEIDVITIIDGILFVLECKNSNLPCNVYEARTSFDYIEKAASQLDRFKEAYSSVDFQEKFGKKLGWDLKNVPLVTGIIMSNRMFVGYRINGHPVRGSLEIKNQVETGIIKMNDEQVCLWQTDHFTGEDLRRFFDEDTGLKPIWAAMQPIKRTYPYEKYSITQNTYALDTEVLARNWGFIKTAKQISKMKGISNPKNTIPNI